MEVILADGSQADLSQFDAPTLSHLQFEQEQAFAAQIKAADKGSPERRASIERGYNTVCSILAAMQGPEQALDMGLDPRYTRLVLKLLARRRPQRYGTPRMFEIGYGSGALLARVSNAGYGVAGIEVSPAVRDLALREVPPAFHKSLYLGDFTTHAACNGLDQFDLVYWNDVWEHVPPDELPDYLARIHELLLPGGCLVTITPNWHERPSDVTGDFCRPRTEARGLHLKEYTLGEVTDALRRTGFARVATPLYISPWNIRLAGGGCTGLKRFAEPLLEYLPYQLAGQVCRRFGLSCTIAYKG